MKFGRLKHCLAGVLLLLGLPFTWAEEATVLNVEGLIAPVEIIKDRWGIPHIYAENQHDLFFAQGYNAASDRLFQFEMWRRRALGLLAEIQGPKAIEHDVGARLLKFRGDLNKDLSHYHKDGQEIIGSFVDGVNAYIRSVRGQPDRLPIEFSLLNIQPEYWTPEVVVSRHNALTGGADFEVMLAKLLTGYGKDKLGKILNLSGDPDLVPKKGVDLERFENSVLAKYQASRNPPEFDASDMHNNARVSDSVNKVLHRAAKKSDFYSKTLLNANLNGSNNWVVSGKRTQSRMPLMANDPHRKIELPSLRYWVHLVAPGWNVIGGGEPVLPGVSIGHNEYGAWGLTIFPLDQEDLYVYEINPKNSNQYRYNGQWEDMILIEESIPVKGRNPADVTLKYTRHGPVLWEDKAHLSAVGLRATWLEVGAAPYLASLRMDQAESWESFRESCKYLGLPGENMIWADLQGNIGWQAVGSTPIRSGWDGALPVPGDGSYEWSGYVPIAEMPHELNPKKGYWSSANENNIPEDHVNIYSFFHADSFRADRIKEVLKGSRKMTVNESIGLQFDEHSIPARTMLPLLLDIDLSREVLPTKNELYALKQLSLWDYKMAKNSVPAILYSKYEEFVEAGMLNILRTEHHDLEENMSYLSRTRMIDWLSNPKSFPASQFETSPVKARTELLAGSFQKAVLALEKQLGADIDGWDERVGKLKYTKLKHPLAQALTTEIGTAMNVGPASRGGDMNTVNPSYSDASGNQLSGASFRIVVDLSDWDLARGTNTPGQSGDPSSVHYSDLFEMWVEGEYFPVYFSKEKIEGSSEHKLILKP